MKQVQITEANAKQFLENQDFKPTNMKKLTKRLICAFKGHRWVIYETYFNGMAQCKCRRCNKVIKDYIWEII